MLSAVIPTVRLPDLLNPARVRRVRALNLRQQERIDDNFLPEPVCFQGAFESLPGQFLSGNVIARAMVVRGGGVCVSCPGVELDYVSMFALGHAFLQLSA
jgi:hypothetical protein